MANPRNHRLSEWLYHTTMFTRFYEQMAGRFAVDILWDELLATFLSQIPEGGTLLDVGAGPGLVARRILEDRPDLTIIVTDFSPKMLELARANLSRASLESYGIPYHSGQVEVVQANAMDLSQFAHRQIDGIYSTGAIKHFPDPIRGLQEAASLLTAGGILYFTDSCADGTYAGTQAIVDKLTLPPVMKPLVHPIFHFGNQREAPSAAEIRSWSSALEGDGTLKLTFSEGNAMFTLVYRKGQRYTTSTTIQDLRLA